MQPLVEQPADRRVGERIDMLEAHHAWFIGLGLGLGLGIG